MPSPSEALNWRIELDDYSSLYTTAGEYAEASERAIRYATAHDLIIVKVEVYYPCRPRRVQNLS